jgi:hypothetical protein
MPLAYYHPGGTSCVRFTNLEQLTCPRSDVKGEAILPAFSQSQHFDVNNFLCVRESGALPLSSLPVIVTWADVCGRDEPRD